MNNEQQNLLTELYSVHSPTGDEWALICLIRKYVEEHLPEVEMQMDRLGNLYFTKGNSTEGYPTLVCHLDQVQQTHSADFSVKKEDGRFYGWSEVNQRYEGLGADDKNGIWMCLQCLQECPTLKVFMAVGEEKGCIGSNRADMSFFSDSQYVLEPDCKGGTELHTVLRGIPCASEEFVTALDIDSYGLVITEGKASDILALTLNGIGVSCANIPAGYHLPHKDDEYTVESELLHTLEFICNTINSLHERFPHRYISETERKVATFYGRGTSK